ncbi:SWIM zinc finger family protein [Saliphagus infecundisoli]|uniref:SWIM zinc finger domain-containing protein n=1 Tax=Saliphagus infecundisoli TaxID=1849069 RepID=A0ABD5QAU4_9EURY|nr:SWIM zinc finger family protein [Saliphagus infecundisoli]
MSDGGWPTLTEATVRELARSKSYERGQSYYERDAVSDVVRRGETLRADVEGSQYQPYTVGIVFDDTGVARTDCSCPYDHGGICKHRVAVLLTCIRDPERVREQLPMSEVIADADREALQELLIELAEGRPEVADLIETRLSTPNDTATGTPVSVNIESIRRQVNHALPKPGQKGHNDAYAEAARMADELGGLIEQAQNAIEAGDGETALDILAVITDELASGRWADLLPYDVPRVFEVIDDLSRTFIEAVLTAELTESERDDWEERLIEWDGQFDYYMGGESTFFAAADAAAQGWDDRRVQQAMGGELDEGEFWDDDAVWYGDDIVAARLSILEREDRIEEYLNLAAAATQTRAYARVLVQDGRIEEALDYATERFSTPDAALGLAETLRAHDETQAALRIAEHGLTLEGYRKDTLAAWLRDQAAGAGDHELALEAAITAFEASPSVSAFEAVEELAKEDWNAIKADLLELLRTEQLGGTAAQVVEIFLREGEYDDAIELVDRTERTSVIEPTVEALIEERPQWVIRTCKSQAEPIVEQGQHDSYRTAVRWLRRAGKAAQAADELDEWREYVETMRDEHYQKYKLRPMLDDLLEEL